MILVSRRIALGAALGAFVMLTAGATSAHPTADIVASNWKFIPAKVEAHVGAPMTLMFTSSEGVHGVESAELGIAKTMIVPDKLSEVKFTPKKAGTYVLHCTIVCGAGHDAMMLTVNVLP